jgi:hypothetical protein
VGIADLAGPIRLFSWHRSERVAEAILRAHLQALLQAPAIDGVNVKLITDFRDRWLQKAMRAAPAKVRLFKRLGLAFSSRQLLKWYKDSLRKEDYLLSRRQLSSRMAGLEPWSFQTHLALEHWFDANDVPQVADELSPTNVKRIEQAFQGRRGIKPGAVVGVPETVLWITFDLSPSERRDGKAGDLRNALGLIRRLGNEYAFLVKLGPRMDAVGAVYAPTAFDAWAYERFRPWPPVGGTRDPDAGRTFDLDPANRTTGADHGKQEMVMALMPLTSCLELKGIGLIGSDPDATAESFEAFADEICSGTTVRSLMLKLQALQDH